jgi:hypothetical protein
MKDTSCGESCPFVKQGFCNHVRECPNFIETWWQEHGESQPIKVNDCSPKRMILQQQIMQSRLETMQQALEQSRNEYIKLCGYFRDLIDSTKKVIQPPNNYYIEGMPYEKSYDSVDSEFLDN